MTGPYKGGTGGSGAGGAFAAMGDATTSYFDKLNTYNQQNEQKRQFDANLAQQQAQAKQTADLQERQLKMQEYDRFDQHMTTLQDYFDSNQEYMTDTQRQVFGDMVQSGQAGVMGYFASQNEEGMLNFNSRYGQGKAWGVDASGQPIDYASIAKTVAQRKPEVELKKSMTAKFGEAQSSFLASVILDPDNAGSPVIQALADGTFQGTPAEAFALIHADNKLGPQRVLRGLQASKMTGADLLLAKKMLDTLPESAYTDKDEAGNPVPNQSYEALQKLFSSPDNVRRMEEAQQAEDIVGGKGTILQYDVNSFTYNQAQVDADRKAVTEKQADLLTMGRLANEGDIGTLTQPGAYAEYVRIVQQDNPNASEEELRAGFNQLVDRANVIDGQRQSLAKSMVTIQGNAALNSVMETGEKQAIYNAISPFFGQDATSQRLLKNLQTEGQITQAQFLNKVLPQMLQLQNDKDKTDLLSELATAKGGIGRPAIQAAFDANLITQADYDALNGLADQSKKLWDQGVNVADMKNQSDYMGFAVSKVESEMTLKYGIPEARAKAAGAEARAAAESSLVAELQARGYKEYAQRVGATQGRMQIRANDAAEITSAVTIATKQAFLAKGIPEAEASALAAQYAATVATSFVIQRTAEGQATTAYDVGVSGNQRTLDENSAASVRATLSRLVDEAMTPFAGDMGTSEARAKIQSNMTTSAEGLVRQYIAEGGLSLARQAGGAEMGARVSTADSQRIAADVEVAYNTGRLPHMQGVGDAEAKLMYQKAITGTLESHYTEMYTQGRLPYATDTGAGTGRADVAEQTARYQTLNSTISLMDMATSAQRQAYATAIAQGKNDEALAILRSSNIPLEYALSQAGVLQGVAGMDPKASLAGDIKDPRLKAMYQNAVRLANEQRAADAALLDYKTSGDSGSGGSGQIDDLRKEANTITATLTAIRNDPAVKNAVTTLNTLTGAKVAIDAVTGISKIVVPADDPSMEPNVRAAWDTIRTAQAQTARGTQRLQQITTLMGQLNTSGAVGQPNAPGAANFAKIFTPGTKLSTLGYSADAISAPGNLSNCSMFARQTVALATGQPAYGSQMSKYFGGYAANTPDSTLEKFKREKAIVLSGFTAKNALQYTKTLKDGDLIFLDYGDKNVSHVAVYRNGMIIQHSSPNFRGQKIDGNVNTMGIEEFFRRAGPDTKVSIGRIPGGSTTAPPRTAPPRTAPPTTAPPAATVPGVTPPRTAAAPAATAAPAAPAAGTPPAAAAPIPRPPAAAPAPNLPPVTAASITKAVPAFKTLPQFKGEYTVAATSLAKELRGYSDPAYIQTRIQEFTLNAFGVKPGVAPTQQQQAQMQDFATQLYDYVLPPATAAKPTGSGAAAPKPAPAAATPPGVTPLTVRPPVVTPLQVRPVAVRPASPPAGARTSPPAYRDPFAKPPAAAPAPAPKPAPAAAPKPTAPMPTAAPKPFPTTTTDPNARPFQPPRAPITTTSVTKAIPALKSLPKFQAEFGVAATALAKELRVANNPQTGLNRIQALTRAAFNIPVDKTPTAQEQKKMQEFATQLYNYIYGGK